ncbi:hypothetical protein ACO0K3_09830 [Undibacterium sp. Rencai35W]|uniref:hypothetical protein n=1 Tax=Undibacterium sp. Rencai35W TaxID=3413046 RepID=UPI003BF2DCC7
MSKKPSRTQLANKLISCAIPGGTFEHEDETYRGFGCGISIPYSTATEYKEALEGLFAEEKSIPQTYTLESFEKEVASFIAPYVLDKTETETSAVTAFLKGISSRPVVVHDVFRPIAGVTVTRANEPVVLGPFTIYNTASHAAHLETELNGRFTKFLTENPTTYLIGVKVSAREVAKALEIGDVLFERFERAIRFMIGRPKSSVDVGILNHSGFTRNQAFIFTDELAASSTQHKGARMPLAIDINYLVNPQIGFNAIWGMFAIASPSEMNQRVLLAIDWIGESYGEQVASSAFIKAAIALEILFNEHKSEFLTKGIAAQISESVALLLGSDVHSKILLEKELKRLYGIRSGIAHAGKSDIKASDLVSIQNLARQSVIRVLKDPAFKDIDTASKMTILFKKLKYGGSAT